MTSSDDEFEVLNKILSALQPLTPERRRHIVRNLMSLLNVSDSQLTNALPDDPYSQGVTTPRATVHGVPYSTDLSISPKQFLLQKQPKTDVERIACLAFYLTHYRDTPHFKTLDLAKLNTEAAQPKFSNTAYAATNAGKMGYLAPAPKGHRQISAAGEQFVQALPDREAAKLAMTGARPRRQSRRKKK